MLNASDGTPLFPTATIKSSGPDGHSAGRPAFDQTGAEPDFAMAASQRDVRLAWRQNFETCRRGSLGSLVITRVASEATAPLRPQKPEGSSGLATVSAS
jgi:hypothetical protein